MSLGALLVVGSNAREHSFAASKPMNAGQFQNKLFIATNGHLNAKQECFQVIELERTTHRDGLRSITGPEQTIRISTQEAQD
jgi:hypothetical protein